MPEQKAHHFSLTNKDDFKMKGVTKVENFDDAEILLETNMGPLILKGDKLHINLLNLETGEMHVTGEVKTIAYLDPQGAKGKGKNILQRILK